MKLTIAYSPCPNDTFMFHGVAGGLLRQAGLEVEVRLHDVETLNELALKKTYDVTKVSLATYLLIRDDYELINAGAALGFGCGPVVVAREALTRDDMPGCKVAIPGRRTTAHLLFQLWAGPDCGQKLFAPYDRIMDMVSGGQADCGLLIHEGRFVYGDKGLKLVADLGQWWHEQTQLPLPLGCIVGRRSLGSHAMGQIEKLLRRSIKSAVENPQAADEYIRRHAAEMDPLVLRQHVDLFVNKYSLDIGRDGLAAVFKLEQLARDAGVLA